MIAYQYFLYSEKGARGSAFIYLLAQGLIPDLSKTPFWSSLQVAKLVEGAISAGRAGSAPAPDGQVQEGEEEEEFEEVTSDDLSSIVAAASSTLASFGSPDGVKVCI